VYEDVVNSDPCFGAVGALYREGILTGTTVSTFVPDQLVTRQDAVAWIMDALSWSTSQASESNVPVRLPFFEPVGGWLGGFRDRSLIGAAHTRAVANAYRLGIVDATADGWFYPTLPLSRGDMAIMLSRAFLRSVSAREAYPEALPAERSYPEQKKKSEGPLVWYIEHRLAALKYRPGPIDGVYDQKTRDAVMAFQKVEKLRRDGVAGKAFWQRITVADTPTPMYKKEGTRVEIDLRRQVLLMITDNQVWKIIHVSTGASGTHVGHFEIKSKYEGWVECVTLVGRMYYPSYVVSRTAIHGYPQVPHYPASHGCIRVPMWMAVELFYETPKGMKVDIYYSR
jgi:lipoprotein-anchoring transpeptidase ErfK/SrfK